MSFDEARGAGERLRSRPAAKTTARRGAGARRAALPTGRLVGSVSAGDTQVSDLQRARLLRAAAEVVGELGYGGMSVARVTARAGVSRRTFYDLFEDREHCFLAVFDAALARVSAVAEAAVSEADVSKAAPAGALDWRGRVRAGLAAILTLLDEEPALGSLAVVDALGAGPRVLEARARGLERLIAIIDDGRAAARAGHAPPPLTAEGVVGAVLAVVHARMLERRRPALIGLLNPLMGMIVMPYLGQGAAARELECPVPRSAQRARRSSKDPLAELDMRLTYRTLRVLAAVASLPGTSNRLIADAAGVSDQGQISKLLARLEALGLVSNSGRGQAKGEPNAWALTAKGQTVEHTVGSQARHGR
jgi:AcrR family transcriptional regulator